MYHALFFIHKKRNEVLICATVWVNLKKRNAQRKKPDSKGHIFSDSFYMNYPE